ncbi:MAG: alpha/beta fold hydrolase [Alphaproteobacteria bacterium]
MRSSLGPVSRNFFSQRLRLHYVDWGNEDKPLLLLVHGGRDHCRNWDWVAEQLREDWHIVAPDLRGHGDSEWTKGSNYSFHEHVLDIAQLIEHLGEDQVTIMAHSMGGSISLRYTGLFPEKVRKIIAIEGMGPPPAMIEQMRKKSSKDRWLNWIEQNREIARRKPRPYKTVEDCIARMQQENSFLNDEQARHLTVNGIIRQEDGTYTWKFDPYMRQMGPTGFDPSEMTTMLGEITCPVMLVRGENSWAADPVEDGRVEAFSNAAKVQVETVKEAGHWVHHDQLDVFLEMARTFLKD